jgi:hypothetical protein
MIAESPATIDDVDLQEQRQTSKGQPISLQRVVGALQVMLATRRAVRSEDHAYWYTVARGM